MLSEASGVVRTVTTRMRKLHGLQRAAVLLLVAAAPPWAVLIAQIWVEVPERALYLVFALALMLPLVAAIFWVGGHNSRRAASLNEVLVENNRVLIGTMGGVILPGAPVRRTGTGPLRAV